MGGSCSRNGEKRNAFRLLVGKQEEPRPLGRPIRRWVDNIKMDHAEVGWGGVDWVGLAEDRDKWRGHLNAVMNLRVHAGNFSGGCTTCGLSTTAQRHSELVSSTMVMNPAELGPRNYCVGEVQQQL
jgi:hypothetical protein